MHQWVETSSKNRLHKTCKIKGLKQISLAGRCTICEHCHLNAQFNSIKVGKNSFLEPFVTVDSSKAEVKLGSYTRIGSKSTIGSGAAIGSRVDVGSGCILEPGCVIRDCCVIEDHVRIPANYLVPPFTRVTIESGTLKEYELPPSYRQINEDKLCILEAVGVRREHSMLTFESSQIQGARNIIEKLTSLGFNKVAHRISTLDAQPASENGDVLVMVTGELLIDDEQNTQRYSQVFHLIPDAGSYYVLNDIFRLNYA
ncbi:hypothetical protein KL938_001967 [Ogataea parapolymorpha]|nr:hypothetical protein KL938_001967 [Ogataea parapolymorpha]